jgi:sulfide dehydrogenase cytochrome subunit
MNPKRSHLRALPAALAACFWVSAQAAEPEGMCADCHGKDGASTESDIPVIAGQSEAYLNDAMSAYRDKKRPCPETRYRAGDTTRAKTDMCQIATKIGTEDAARLAKHVAGEPFVKARQKFDSTKAATGKKIHDQTCEKCHSNGGTSPDDDAGILAGQWTSYLKQTLGDMMSGKRPIPQKMKVKTDTLKPADVEALLNYYASQQ